LLLNIDIKSTEWIAINWFAQDPIGCKEIRDGIDQHLVNQVHFGLPNRTVAKVFVFRLVYGGTSYSYCFDANFNWISKQPKYWQRVIDSFYDKYRGIARQHTAWMNEAIETSCLKMPTGRFYRFIPFRRPDGSLKWPRTKILNYPVQGLGHDLTTIARVSLYKRIKNNNELAYSTRFISTVHDSIVLDFEAKHLSILRPIVDSVARDLPVNFNKLFGVEFNLPIVFELSTGDNLRDMSKV
jgi:DNA polymerase I-like protein with 3'-5' exonuclease and polymerase domains